LARGRQIGPGKTGFFLRFGSLERVGTFGSRPDYFCKDDAPVWPAPKSRQNFETEDGIMLSWVVTFLVIALIAGILGFGGLAGASIEIAKIIFFVAVILFVVSAVVGVARGRSQV
jgi:uncharacterized membrane protein YtjA (UPF0391 family)